MIYSNTLNVIKYRCQPKYRLKKNINRHMRVEVSLHNMKAYNLDEIDNLISVFVDKVLSIIFIDIIDKKEHKLFISLKNCGKEISLFEL